jgi:cyclopropane fatty-acyl-phospholipid synthase-like methyltransferase
MSEYQKTKAIYKSDPGVTLGMQAAATWMFDPKRLTFVLARYKFVSKMLLGKEQVLEIGCGDAWASRVVRQQVGKLDCIDIDSDFVSNGKKLQNNDWDISLYLHDILKPYKIDYYDAAYALDVFEHIQTQDSDLFMKNVINAIKESGVLIIGIPSIESQKFSSADNGHVNCMNGKELKLFCEQYFHNCFIFSMNDEVIHTGMYEMSNYLFAICTSKRN